MSFHVPCAKSTQGHISHNCETADATNPCPHFLHSILLVCPCPQGQFSHTPMFALHCTVCLFLTLLYAHHVHLCTVQCFLGLRLKLIPSVQAYVCLLVNVWCYLGYSVYVFTIAIGLKIFHSPVLCVSLVFIYCFKLLRKRQAGGNMAEDGCNPLTSGLCDQHAPTVPLCWSLFNSTSAL